MDEETVRNMPDLELNIWIAKQRGWTISYELVSRYTQRYEYFIRKDGELRYKTDAYGYGEEVAWSHAFEVCEYDDCQSAVPRWCCDLNAAIVLFFENCMHELYETHGGESIVCEQYSDEPYEHTIEAEVKHVDGSRTIFEASARAISEVWALAKIEEQNNAMDQ